jgi:hypothetical protein
VVRVCPKTEMPPDRLTEVEVPVLVVVLVVVLVRVVVEVETPMPVMNQPPPNPCPDESSTSRITRSWPPSTIPVPEFGDSAHPGRINHAISSVRRSRNPIRKRDPKMFPIKGIPCPLMIDLHPLRDIDLQIAYTPGTEIDVLSIRWPPLECRVPDFAEDK